MENFIVENFYALMGAAVLSGLSPFLVNIVSGIILTVKNRFSDTPKFDIGSVFSWSQLPASGSVFPLSVLVGKSLTACHFIDIRPGNGGGKFSITKSRWMISSAGFVGRLHKKKVNEQIEKHKKQIEVKENRGIEFFQNLIGY